MTDYSIQAENLLRKMTVEEKIAQLCSIWLLLENDGRLGVRTLEGLRMGQSAIDPFKEMKNGIGQITRPLGTKPVPPIEGVRLVNRVQKFLKEETRLGIPALPHEECLAGLMAQGATCFPAGINNGALWDPELVEEIGRAIGDELYSVGSRQGLSPVLDVARDARWGRTEESCGEDPYLVGCTASAYVRGLQGPDGRLVATLKHFVGHSFSEGGRNHAPVRIGRRELADTFLLPFEMAVKLAGASSVMPAYHDIDGVPLHQSYEYLTRILRDEWGFQGTIVSDYEGISQLHTDHRTQGDYSSTAAAALSAGVDVELPGSTVYRKSLRKALEEGKLEMAVLDQAVKRVLTQKFRLGLFDNPWADEGALQLNTPEHRSLAREAAAKSMVLLKNDGILPLKKDTKLALIGPLADDPLGMYSGYSFPVHLIISGIEDGGKNLPSLKQELDQRVESPLIYSRGCDILTRRSRDSAVFPGDVAAEGNVQKTFISRDTSKIEEAVTAAGKADTIVLALGDLAGLFLSGTVGEGSDTSSLELPGVQARLLDAVLNTGKPVIIVCISGRPYNLGRGVHEAAAILQAWLPGQEGPAAISDALFGKVNPGGKLPVSIPRKAGAMPFFYNYKMKSAGMPIQPDFGAEYPFGFGLSYTSFELSDFSVQDEAVPTDGEVVMVCRLKNTGKLKGDQVVQLYVRDLYASTVRPVMELKAFKRVSLAPGEITRLTFRVPCDMLSFTGLDHRRIVEPGDFEFILGTSCRDIAYRHRISLYGETRYPGKYWSMESAVEILRE
ncbi:glycoside hydrolase family 3 N-terminal domain-containing protein [Marispirochaeta aestuarii]|uniref:glycoside hydrolase family 3 N-terminal domain-containing protein n=1 Tax=Marispirochaeta aestuarii TaxID=1963862 RepID=UPI0029C6BE2A|nr:glycoside hydrolase family 3 N-terminal domain-containing protein [Marispirochaeta aestuarii]